MAKTSFVLLVGSSVDGKVSLAPKMSSKAFGQLLTPAMSRPIVEQREWAQAILTSRQTLAIDNSKMKQASNPKLIRCVIDRKLKLKADRHFFDGTAATIIFTTVAQTEIPVAKKRFFTNRNVELVTLPTEYFFSEVKNFFRSRKITRVLVEGGGNFNRLLLDLQMIDELIVAYFPFIIGGSTTPTLVDGSSLSDITQALKLKLISSQVIAEQMVVNHYQVSYPEKVGALA